MVEPDDKFLASGSPDAVPGGDLSGSDPASETRNGASGSPKTPAAAQEESDLSRFEAWRREAAPFSIIHQSGQNPAELMEVRNLLRSRRASVAGWIRQRSPNDRDIIGRRPQFYSRDRAGSPPELNGAPKRADQCD